MSDASVEIVIEWIERKCMEDDYVFHQWQRLPFALSALNIESSVIELKALKCQNTPYIYSIYYTHTPSKWMSSSPGLL